MKTYANPIIAERINIMKRNLLISDKELAVNVGAERRTVLSWRQGAGKIPADAIKIWATRYNVSAEWLLGLTDEGEPEPRKATKRGDIQIANAHCVESKVNNAPTINATPLAHWKSSEQGTWCSRCRVESIFEYDYCPHCGAKMDGD